MTSGGGKWLWPYANTKPYGIQEELMDAIYQSLDDGRSGVFESPTGTGKSRSIICSTIPWLLNNLEKKPQEEVVVKEDDGEPSWLLDFAHQQTESNLQRADFLRQQREDRVKQVQQEGGVCPSTTVRKMKKPKVGYEEEDDANARVLLLATQRHREEEAEVFSDLRKIYFCSRTHTQLAQFAGELRKINHLFARPVSCIVLGSRQHLCVNEELKKKHSSSTLNDACLDLNDTAGKCSFNADAAHGDWLADYALGTHVPDLEDLSSHDACPYYASRQASRSAQIILLPYSSILNSETRAALDIDLEGNVVVFDEAHNLVDAVADAHSCVLTMGQLKAATEDVTNYVAKYDRLHLDTKNLLTQLATLVMPKLMLIATAVAPAAEEECIMTVDAFLTKVKLQDFNLLPLLNKAKELKLNRKLKAVSTSQITILSVLSFLHSLAHHGDTGRIKYTPGTTTQSIKFFVLDIATQFASITRAAHAVLLCGGTMHPHNEVVAQLFPNQQENKVTMFSCGHVIPKDNLCVLQVGKSPTSRELRFTHDHALYDDLRAVLRNLCAVCPEGMVVFFPSYGMLDKFQQHTASVTSAFPRPVIVESRQSGSGDAFAEYEQALRQSGAAMLLAVVGGKLSEGINFSDSLARCVVMVGLPFPNKHECETQERMAFYERTFGPGAGQRHLENQCWKAVNQSVGRAIRHQRDYALVVLLDVRFAGASQHRLPTWIADRFSAQPDWGAVMRAATSFFRMHK